MMIFFETSFVFWNISREIHSMNLQFTQFIFVGKRYVQRGGRDSDDCTTSRYQPTKFWSNVTSDCEMLKSTCCEPGQVAVSDGSTKNDRACRCDLLNGFAFITLQIDVCSCIPTQEDCNCYRKEVIQAEGMFYNV